MTKQTDLTYYVDGMFTVFHPVSPAGVQAWNELAMQTHGTGKILNIEIESCLHSLRSSGYTVVKTKKPKLSKKQFEELLDDFDKLFE